MLGRSSGRLTVTQLVSSKDSFISCSTHGGAEAVNAIKGAVVSALSPPSCLNAVLKCSPLLYALRLK